MERVADDWPAWGRLIEDARESIRPQVSQNEAARRLNMSGTNWRRIVQGASGPMTSPRGIRRIAQMAQIAGVSPEALAGVGREDVASELLKLMGPGEPSDVLDEAEALMREVELDLPRLSVRQLRAVRDTVRAFIGEHVSD